MQAQNYCAAADIKVITWPCWGK